MQNIVSFPISDELRDVLNVLVMIKGGGRSALLRDLIQKGLEVEFGTEAVENWNLRKDVGEFEIHIRKKSKTRKSDRKKEN